VDAIRVAAHGGPEVLDFTETPTPEPGPGQLLVEVAAAGVNFRDTYHRKGLYPKPVPFTPGGEFAGVVAAVGDGVEGFTIGDKVAGAEDLTGSYAEFTLVDPDRALRVPEGIELDTAAAAVLQGMTAHYLVRSTWPIKAGDTALVHAAAGGMGLLLTQWIKNLGGRVIGTVSTAEKEAKARAAGADEVIRYTEVDDLAAAVRAANGGRGVDVVYDGVGATTFEASLASLRHRGLLALYGAASGPVPPFDPQRLNGGGSLFLTRPTLEHHTETPAELAWRAGELFEAIRSGALEITIGARYPLAEAAAAHIALESRATIGKVLLIP
jgi:NADPH:quinone reductase